MYSKKAIDMRRIDREYVRDEQKLQTESAKRTLMIGGLIVAAVGVVGNLTAKFFGRGGGGGILG